MAGDGYGVRLRRLRERLAWTQDHLAELAGIRRETLARIEGGRRPSAQALTSLHAVLSRRVQGLDLDMRLTEPSGSVGAAVRRRDFLAAASAIVPATLALRMVASERSTTPTLTPELLENWEARTANFAAARALEPPQLLLPQLENHLLVLEAMIEQWPGPERLRWHLLSIAAGANAIAGWVSTMAERRREARDYLGRAEELARQVGDTDTLILAPMLRANLHSPVHHGGDGGHSRLALRALDEAMSLASPATPMTVRAPAALRAAEEYAAIGDGRAALRLLDEGAEIVESSRRREHYLRRTWPDWAVASWRGSVFQLLGRPKEAIEALAPIESPYPGHRPLMLADLGAAHAQDGNLDEAAWLLADALEQAAAHGVPEAARRAQGLRRRHLARWNTDPRVRILDERIAAIL